MLGAAGMLARSLIRAIKADPEFRPAAPDERDCDVTIPASLEEAIRRHRPDLAINCAAFTDVDGCELDPEKARKVNAEGAMNAAFACEKANVRFLHISTDFVFDGRNGRPYREDDPPNPLSVYGATKLEGERLVAARSPRALIVRTAWTFGPGRANFVSKVLERAGRERKFSVVIDQVGSPTYTADLADGILDLVHAQASGVFHLVNSGSCSRHEFALAILELSGVKGVTVETASSSSAPGTAPRPAMSVLDTSSFRRLTGRTMRPWREALASYIRSGGDA